MLQQTFIHLPGVGEVNEQRLWRAGVRSWQDFVAGHEAGKFRGRRIERAIAQVQESIVRYAQSEWSFFDGVIPSPHKWRAFADLGKSALYVDIETTGMGARMTSPSSASTMAARCDPTSPASIWKRPLHRLRPIHWW
ncbi:MAG TPA: hypothetical protein PLE77_10480 [Kiritimatiellia bacterium]|nr:hypothetical protein [Kiritimatiellia bacterium]